MPHARARRPCPERLRQPRTAISAGKICIRTAAVSASNGQPAAPSSRHWRHRDAAQSDIADFSCSEACCRMRALAAGSPTPSDQCAGIRDSPKSAVRRTLPCGQAGAWIPIETHRASRSLSRRASWPEHRRFQLSAGEVAAEIIRSVSRGRSLVRPDRCAAPAAPQPWQAIGRQIDGGRRSWLRIHRNHFRYGLPPDRAPGQAAVENFRAMRLVSIAAGIAAILATSNSTSCTCSLVHPFARRLFA